MRTLLNATALVALISISSAQVGSVVSQRKIGSTSGAFTGPLLDGDAFAISVAALGDLDGDGIGDLAVGAHFDDDSGSNSGAVWILNLNPDGTVRSEKKITENQGGFFGDLNALDYFGRSVAALDDLDGNGIPELVVGASTGGGSRIGSVWILFVDSDGSVQSHSRITKEDLDGVVIGGDLFGSSVASLGDLDGDGVCDLAVGAIRDNDGGPQRGAVWIIFMEPDGAVKSHQKISNTQGSFSGELVDADQFGVSLTCLGDIDSDGVQDLGVGMNSKHIGSQDGAIWILFLNTDGTVKGSQRISRSSGGFVGALDDGDLFGTSLVSVGDLDLDGTEDLAVGSTWDDDGGVNRGATWILFLDPDGTVKSQEKISDATGGFHGVLDDSDELGSGLGFLGDQDHDGYPELAVGSVRDDDGGLDRGAVWILSLQPGPSASAQVYGCGVNPPGSMTILSGVPSLGSTIVFGIDNPIGTQSPGSIPALALAASPASEIPCGLIVPGLGMQGDGELLISLRSRIGPLAVGFPWAGPGMPSPIALGIPADPSLLGLTIYAQGIMYDPTVALGVDFALTDAVELVIGP